MRIAVVIPAFNEADTIGKVVRGVPRVIDDKHGVDVVVIDDGSTDDTSKLATKAGAEEVYSHVRNLGVAAGFISGIQKALNLGADIVCTIDADGQFSPRQVPDMVQPILSGDADAVVGTRFNVEYTNRSVPISNRISNKIVAFGLSLLLATRLTDVSSGYRAFHARVVPFLNVSEKWNTHGFLFDLLIHGFRVTEIPVAVRYYRDRKSKAIHSFWAYGMSVFMDIAKRVVSRILMRDNSRNAGFA